MGVLALIVLGLMGWRLAQPVYRMRRITKAFTQRYRYVRDFLSQASTDRLNQFRRLHDPADRMQEDAWLDLDDQLSTEFLRAWQQADEAEEEAGILQKWGYASQCRYLLENEAILLERTPEAMHDELKRIFAKPLA